jgi:hypothetical protein
VDERILEAHKKAGRIEGSTLDLVQSIIAHELGHFVAHITKCPTHNQSTFDKIPVTINGEAAVVGVSVPAEIKAWTLAGEILGDKLNQKLRTAATATYLMGRAA